MLIEQTIQKFMNMNTTEKQYYRRKLRVQTNVKIEPVLGNCNWKFGLVCQLRVIKAAGAREDWKSGIGTQKELS